MSTMVDLLSRTRSLVARGWTQKADARDEDGKAMRVYYEGATCWCLSGAIIAASPDRTLEKHQARYLLWRAGRVLGYPMDRDLAFKREANPKLDFDEDRLYRWVLEDFNDQEGRTQDEVLALLDKALEIANKETIDG